MCYWFLDLTSSWFLLRAISSSFRDSSSDSNEDLTRVRSSRRFLKPLISASTVWRMTSSFSYLYHRQQRPIWDDDSQQHTDLHVSIPINMRHTTQLCNVLSTEFVNRTKNTCRVPRDTHFIRKSSAVILLLSISRSILLLSTVAEMICKRGSWRGVWVQGIEEKKKGDPKLWEGFAVDFRLISHKDAGIIWEG